MAFHIHKIFFEKRMNPATILDVLDYIAEIRESKNSESGVYLVLDVFRGHVAD